MAGRVAEPPDGAFRAGMLRSGMSEEAVDAILTRMRDDPPPAEIQPTVQHVLGRPATPFTDWLARHRDVFTARAGGRT